MKQRRPSKILLIALCCSVLLMVYISYDIKLKRYNYSLSSIKVTKPTEPTYHYTMVIATAYCICEVCCGKWAYRGFKDGQRVTASGDPAEGFLVAAPKSTPFGTLLSIPGYADGSWVPVRDRGGAIKGNRIDVLMSSHAEALQWGIRTVRIKVMESEDE